MIYHKITANCPQSFMEEARRREKNVTKRFDSESMLSRINRQFFSNYNVEKKHLIVVTDVMEGQMNLVAIFDAEDSDLNTCEESICRCIPDIEILEIQEITLEELKRELTRAEENEWMMKSVGYLFRELRLRINPDNYSIFDGPPYKIEERVCSAKGVTKQKTLNQLSDIMASNAFYEEIERIYSKENEKKFWGHPVHYLITAGDKAAADEMIDILIPALIKNKRLLGGRVCDVQKLTAKAYREENFHNVFYAGKGGTVVINLAIENEIGGRANAYHELLEYISQKINSYGKDTLFIFVDVSGSRNISDEAMAAILANADMIHISEGYGDRTKAKEYLERLAKKSKYPDYDVEELVKYLPEEKAEYTVTDIYAAYNRWYGSGLKTHVYRAYKEQDVVKLEVKKRSNQPYEELQKLVGLADVKRVTDEIIANARVQRMRKALGLDNNSLSMHMLFSGNPGSAKTTVARLLAQILKDEEVLTHGQLIECGRQDLVARYVGWTAKAVEEKFRAARGGILFIDEAYSLVDDRNSFGTEAVNTIVQMMENYRDEVIVIFAGYPDRMQEFLEQNEGLKSRIAFHMNFSDYDTEELMDIMSLTVEKMGYKLAPDFDYDKCRTICAMACREKDYGNGRFVRNLVEHAIMRQANRLLQENKNQSVTKEEAMTLKADDFEVLGLNNKKKQPRHLGFAG